MIPMHFWFCNCVESTPGTDDRCAVCGLQTCRAAADTIARMTTHTPSQPDLDDTDDGGQYFKGLDAHDAQTASEAPDSTPTTEAPNAAFHDSNTDDCVCIFCRMRRGMEAKPEILTGKPCDLVFQRDTDQPEHLVRIAICADPDAEVLAEVTVSTDFLRGVVAQRDLIAGVKLEAPKSSTVKVEVTPADVKAFTRSALGKIFGAALDRIEAEDAAAEAPPVPADLDDPTRPVE